MLNRQYRKDKMQLQYQKVKSLKFGVISDNEMLQQKTAFIRSSQINSNKLGSLLDLHLGSLSKSIRCLTCNNTKKLCQGHCGVIKCKYPYILPQYEQNVIAVLKRLCLNCNILVQDNRKCSVCKETAPIVKSQKGYNIDVIFAGKPRSISIPQLKTYLSNIRMEDVKRIIGISVHPSNLIVNHVMVASPVIRPDRRVQNVVKREDEYTVSLQTIAKHVLMLNDLAESDPKTNKLYESFIQMLQQYQLGDKSEDGDAKTKSLNTSLCGKKGKIRSAMLGKRINNIGRCVTACDISNAPDEATLPLEFVQSIHIKEVLRDYNRDRLMSAYNNGPHVYPGADFVQKPDGRKYRITGDNVTFQEGDTIYRHLQAGDRVIVNRQPSLLANSLGSHRIKVATDNTRDTIDINTLAVSQYHADFDGQSI